MIITKSVSASTAISRVVARQMADVLVASPTADLRDEDACTARLAAHGFGSLSIANVLDQARDLADEIVAASSACRSPANGEIVYHAVSISTSDRAGYLA